MIDAKATLAASGHNPNKALGQNFLADASALEAIVDGACIDGKAVLEIGAGLGTLTAALAERAERVVAVEIDRSLETVLRGNMARYDNVRLIFADFLKLGTGELREALGGGEVHVAANLPYYITSPVSMKLLRCGLPIESMTLMLQKEAAMRFFAKPSDKIYGPLTVLSQAAYGAKRLMELSPESYYPRPTVDSTVIRLESRHNALPSALDEICSAAFANRRKTLVNNLASCREKDKVLGALDLMGFKHSVRGEELSAEEFIRLAELLGD